MPNVKSNKINEDVICVLKFAPNSNFVIVDYEIISKTLEKEFNDLLKLFGLENKTAKSILAFVKNHYKLKVLLSQFNYCRSLQDTYQGLYLSIEDIEQKYLSNFTDPSYKIEDLNNEKNNLLLELKERLLAFYLQEAYKVCERKRIAKLILAYSHRKDGWATPKYFLNTSFSIEIKTNFGYGYASYFYTRIRYKELDIIPFSDWVRYEFAKVFEIIRYSAKYKLENESWKDALEYSRDACNLSLKNEIRFIRKYILDECERMVNGLEKFLVEDKFEFLTWNKIYTDVHKEGHNLIEFRGEKISGALDFIEKIIQFEKVTEIKKFIYRIENCNRKVQPMLKSEVRLIKKELEKLNIILERLKPIYEDLERQNDEFENKRTALRNEFIVIGEESDFDHDKFENNFIEMYPEYETFKPIYDAKKKEYRNLLAKILSLETTKVNIDNYNSAIETYFKISKRDK